MAHPVRLELTRLGLLVYLANYYTITGAQIILGIGCTQDRHSYLWTFPPAVGTAGKKWPIRDEDWKHLKLSSNT